MTAKSINKGMYFLRENLVTMFLIKIFRRNVSVSPFLEISEKFFANVGLTTDFARSTSIRVS